MGKVTQAEARAQYDTGLGSINIYYERFDLHGSVSMHVFQNMRYTCTCDASLSPVIYINCGLNCSCIFLLPVNLFILFRIQLAKNIVRTKY